MLHRETVDDQARQAAQSSIQVIDDLLRRLDDASGELLEMYRREENYLAGIRRREISLDTLRAQVEGLEALRAVDAEERERLTAEAVGLAERAEGLAARVEELWPRAVELPHADAANAQLREELRTTKRRARAEAERHSARIADLQALVRTRDEEIARLHADFAELETELERLQGTRAMRLQRGYWTILRRAKHVLGRS